MSLKLHEAIAAVLSTKKDRTATTTLIASEINERNLYQKKDGSLVQPKQIKQRTKPSKGQYNYIFKLNEHNMIKHRNL